MENDQFLDKLVLNLVPKSLWPAGLLEAERLKEEQKITAIAQLRSIADPIHISVNDAAALLSSYRWNVDNSCLHLKQLVAAEQGDLVPLNSQTCLVGMVNSLGTSCYISSLLFALFSTHSLFDGLLTPRLLSPTALRLQSASRMVVNYIRQGFLVSEPVIEHFRNSLAACGWGGGTATVGTTQEDAAELFLFLMEHFDAPYLPISKNLVKDNGKTRENDERIVSERMLQISLPEPPSPVNFNNYDDEDEEGAEDELKVPTYNLYNLLQDYFTSSEVDNNGLLDSVETRSSLYLCPYWTAENETGIASTFSDNDVSDQRIAIPITLKRFSYMEGITCKRICRVIAPEMLDFTNFVIRDYFDSPSPSPLTDELSILDDYSINNTFDSNCTLTREKRDYRLLLRGAICHYGPSLHSGHYFTLVPEHGNSNNSCSNWLRMDDSQPHSMKENPIYPPRRSSRIYNSSRVSMVSRQMALDEIAISGYVLIYELVSFSPKHDYDGVSVEDRTIARQLQIREFRQFAQILRGKLKF